jgi:hypothetical protein
MKTISFVVKNSTLINSGDPIEHDLDAKFGGTVTEVKAIAVVKLDDVNTMITVSATLAGDAPEEGGE